MDQCKYFPPETFYFDVKGGDGTQELTVSTDIEVSSRTSGVMVKVMTQDVNMFGVSPTIFLLAPNSSSFVHITVKPDFREKYFAKARTTAYTFLFNELALTPEEEGEVRGDYVEGGEGGVGASGSKREFKERLSLAWKAKSGVVVPRGVTIRASLAGSSSGGGLGRGSGGASSSALPPPPPPLETDTAPPVLAADTAPTLSAATDATISPGSVGNLSPSSSSSSSHYSSQEVHGTTPAAAISPTSASAAAATAAATATSSTLSPSSGDKAAAAAAATAQARVERAQQEQQQQERAQQERQQKQQQQQQQQKQQQQAREATVAELIHLREDLNDLAHKYAEQKAWGDQLHKANEASVVTRELLERQVKELEKSLENARLLGGGAGLAPLGSGDGVRERRKSGGGGRLPPSGPTGGGGVVEEEGEEQDGDRDALKSGTGFTLSLMQIILLVIASVLLGRLSVSSPSPPP